MERIARAFLFHEGLATKDEGATLDEALEHVLWYYPAEASRPERVKHVGLAQALLAFGDRFHHRHQQQRRRRRRRRRHENGAAVGGGDGGEEESREWPGVPLGKVEVVRTRQHCHGFLECEPGVWLVMVLVSRRRQEQQPEDAGNPKASRPSTRSLLRSAVFGRGIGVSPPSATTDPRGHGSRADHRVDAAVRSPSPAARDRSPSSPAAARSVRNDRAGGGGGGSGDWVDETALHAAMGTAYQTLALMHGPVSSALDAPAALPPPPSGDGAGGGGDVTVPGLEVLRRLASARKRLRKAKKEALDLAEHAAYSGEVGEIGEEGGSVESLRQELLESRVRLEGREVAVLLRASPAEVLRETLEDFFSSYLPGAGLAEPHFHLDMGYPQSLPMDPYRRQLGLRIQRRVRQRIRSLLLGGGIDVEVDFAMTLAGGALLLACKDPQPVEAAILGQNSTAGVNSSTRNGYKEERQTIGGGDKTSGGGTRGKEAVENILGRDAASAGSETQTPGETGGDESRGKPQQQQSGGGAVLSGKEASLLVGYLRAAALTAEETGRAQEGSVAGPSAAVAAAAAAAPLLGEEDGGKDESGEEEGPPMSLWAAFRSGISTNDDDDDDAGVKGSGGGGGGGGVRPARPPPATGAGGLLRRDGSLASCAEASVLRYGGDTGDCAIWAPELHYGVAERPGTTRDNPRNEKAFAARGSTPPAATSAAAAAASADAGSFTGRDGHSFQRRRRRRVVAYVRGGLCSLVAFRERERRCDGTGAAAGGEEVATGDDAQGEVGQRRLDHGAAHGSDEPRSSWPADDERAGGCGWSELQLLSLGRAIDTSLSEDPDLTVLEDDVGDFYFQLLTAGEDAGGNDARSGSGGHPRRRQQSRRSGPVRAVHHQDSPLPCFSGTGIVRHPPAPAPAAQLGGCGLPVGAGDDSTGAEDDNRLSISGSSGEGPVIGRLAANVSSGGGGSSSALLLFGGRKESGVCGGDGGGSGSAGGDVGPLLDAFGRQGRADLGVEAMRRRGAGGEQELSVLDEVHACLTRGDGGGTGRSAASPAAREIGIRTSMSKGNRWVIGRRLAGESGGGGRSRLGHEVYATIEAPVLSVGDARAAASRVFSGVACDGLAAGDDAVAGRQSAGPDRSRASEKGLERRRFLR
ncbi:unnamed protein product [Ectocarpus sp. 6 AP-2014]